MAARIECDKDYEQEKKGSPVSCGRITQHIPSGSFFMSPSNFYTLSKNPTLFLIHGWIGAFNFCGNDGFCSFFQENNDSWRE
jgi:hypothetical protein